ncbi:MAG: hypothetical protein SGPRY_006370, partial [Prymnesium sp.]
HFHQHSLPMPPIGITEYNCVFRQYIAFLWQTAFIGQAIALPPITCYHTCMLSPLLGAQLLIPRASQAVIRGSFGLLNHFSARSMPVACSGTSDFDAFKVDGVSKRAPKDSYSIVEATFPQWYGGDRVIAEATESEHRKVFITRFESTGEIGVIAVNWDVQTELTIRPDAPELQALKAWIENRGAMVGVVGINQHVFTARMGTGKYKGDPHVQSDNKLFMTEEAFTAMVVSFVAGLSMLLCCYLVCGNKRSQLPEDDELELGGCVEANGKSRAQKCASWDQMLCLTKPSEQEVQVRKKTRPTAARLHLERIESGAHRLEVNESDSEEEQINMLEERRKKKKNKANVGCSNVSVDVCWDALRTAEMGTAFCGGLT